MNTNTIDIVEKKKPLTDEQKAASKRLRKIWDAKKGELGLSQPKAAEWMGISQGAVSHYLNAVNPIGTMAALKFAALLQVDPSEILVDDVTISGLYRLIRAQALDGLPEIEPWHRRLIELSDWLDEDERDMLMKHLEEKKRDKLRAYELVSRKGG